MNSSVGHLSSHTIDGLFTASLPADESAHATLHLEYCRGCRERYRQVRADVRYFDEVIFPRTVAAVARRLARDSAERAAG